MGTLWKNEYFAICTDANKQSCNVSAQVLMGDPPGSENFSIPLSSDGNTVTHWGCHIVLTDDQRAALNNMAAAKALPAMDYWRMDREGTLLSSSDSSATVGVSVTIEDILKDAGLVHLEPKRGA